MDQLCYNVTLILPYVAYLVIVGGVLFGTAWWATLIEESNDHAE